MFLIAPMFSREFFSTFVCIVVILMFLFKHLVKMLMDRNKIINTNFTSIFGRYQFKNANWYHINTNHAYILLIPKCYRTYIYYRINRIPIRLWLGRKFTFDKKKKVRRKSWLFGKFHSDEQPNFSNKQNKSFGSSIPSTAEPSFHGFCGEVEFCQIQDCELLKKTCGILALTLFPCVFVFFFVNIFYGEERGLFWETIASALSSMQRTRKTH
jgi:hypothetical protein